MVNKDATERCVYVLPTELRERIRAYQAANGIGSEVEAARRLLDTALQLGDTIVDVLNKLASRFKEERDLRVLARDVLVGHALVQGITMNEGDLEFRFKNGAKGSINRKGSMHYSEDEEGYMREYNLPNPNRSQTTSQTSAQKAKTWEPSGGGDLDDEIPF